MRMHGGRFITAALLGLLVVPARAADLTVTGDWSQAVDGNDLVSGAGSDLTPDYSSDPAQVSVSISNTTGSWQLKARRTDTVWDGDLTLELRRASAGIGSGSVAGGATYVTLSSIDTVICSGSGALSDIDFQLRLGGVSVGGIPVDTYSTSITYTVVDAP